jgi:hypothetical protein
MNERLAVSGVDGLLERSAPALAESPAVREEVADLVRAARTSSVRRRRTRRRLAVGTATAVLVPMGRREAHGR